MILTGDTYWKMTLNKPSPNRAIPIMMITAPAILFIHKIVLIWKFFLKWLSIQVIRNQYTAEPALTERMIGITLQL